jgi:hypothetical protein
VKVDAQSNFFNSSKIDQIAWLKTLLVLTPEPRAEISRTCKGHVIFKKKLNYVNYTYKAKKLTKSEVVRGSWFVSMRVYRIFNKKITLILLYLFCTDSANIFINPHPACRETEKGGEGERVCP